MSMSIFNVGRLLIAVLFTAAVAFVTHLPEDAIPSLLAGSDLDKLEHVLAYGVITLLFILSIRTSFTLLSASLLLFAILGIATFDELTQPFVNRTASLTDWLADVVGVFVVLLSWIILKARPQSTLTEASDG